MYVDDTTVFATDPLDHYEILEINQIYENGSGAIFRSDQVRSGMGARAATELRRAHLFAPLPRPIPGDRPGLRRVH